MKKRMLGLVSAALCAALLAGCASGTSSVSSAVESAPGAEEGQKLSVYTSFYTMQDFAEKIGGDKVTVTNLVPPGDGAARLGAPAKRHCRTGKCKCFYL